MKPKNNFSKINKPYPQGEIIMSELIKNENNFIGYEYKDVLVSRRMESVFSDAYVNFGWILDSVSTSIHNYASIVMKFKRDRKIRNKMELTRLQRQFESAVAEIETLERSKIIGASTVAYGTGILGTAFMAGSVFSYLGGMLPLCIILAVPAFIGWIAPYFCFTTLRNRKSAEVEPLIDSKYDEIYDVCEKASALAAAE
jgi:hypothetical protein